MVLMSLILCRCSEKLPKFNVIAQIDRFAHIHKKYGCFINNFFPRNAFTAGQCGEVQQTVVKWSCAVDFEFVSFCLLCVISSSHFFLCQFGSFPITCSANGGAISKYSSSYLFACFALAWVTRMHFGSSGAASRKYAACSRLPHLCFALLHQAHKAIAGGGVNWKWRGNRSDVKEKQWTMIPPAPIAPLPCQAMRNKPHQHRSWYPGASALDGMHVLNALLALLWDTTWNIGENFPPTIFD